MAASRSGSRISNVEFSAPRWTRSSVAGRSGVPVTANYNDAERPPEGAAMVADSQLVRKSRAEWRRGEEGYVM